MASREHDVRTHDGRTLRVHEAGDPRGHPVFSLHGTPGSRLLYPKHANHAAAHGIRLIGYDRPGYGGSSPHRDRRMADAASDTAAIADALGFDRFGVWGHSGGADHALACAALLPDRVVAAAALAGGAPPAPKGYDTFEGMGDFNAEDLRLLLNDRAAWEAKAAKDVEEMRQATPEQMLEQMSSLLSDVDRAVFRGDLVTFIHEQIREGLRSGAEGYRDDNLEGLVPWGFELDAIRVPLQLWHGRQDRFVPFSRGEWLAAHIPDAEAHLEPAEGHVSLYENRIPEVQEWIVAHF